MPRYFFDFRDQGHGAQDTEGVSFEDPEQGRRQAIGVLAEMAHAALPDGQQRSFTVVMSDDQRKPVFQAALVFDSKWVDGR